VRITSKGQVTLPQAIRKTLGLLPNTDVEFVVEGASVRIREERASRGGRAFGGRIDSNPLASRMPG
jgi:AbrB family looped-hinge helix DNA binding protein